MTGESQSADTHRSKIKHFFFSSSPVPSNLNMSGESHGHEEEDDGLDVGPGKAHKHIEKGEHEEVVLFLERIS